MNGQASGLGALEPVALLVGRLLMSIIFIIGGWGKLMAGAATTAYFAKVGLPLPEVGYYVAVIVELIGGLMLLFGVLTRWVGLVLAIWCVATALTAHTVWSDPAAGRNQQIHFFKNMAMCGGFLFVAVFGGGAFAVDALMGRRRAMAVGRA